MDQRLDIIETWIKNVRWHIDNNGHTMTASERAHEYARIGAWCDVLCLFGRSTSNIDNYA